MKKVKDNFKLTLDQSNRAINLAVSNYRNILNKLKILTLENIRNE